MLTRSRRSGADVESSLQLLASLIVSGKRVLFLTGAGMSVASGIPTFRGADGTWASYLLEWGTRGKFLADPVGWYNRFWLPAHERVLSRPSIQPNLGHRALADILRLWGGSSKLVTQNIDNLHVQSSGGSTTNIIECHGRHGLWKCVNDKAGCRFAQQESLTGIVYSYGGGDGGGDGGRRMISAPTCEGCGDPVLPQALFFDEAYQSHDFYRWSEMERWFLDADAFVFVGTSFADIMVTELALAEAARRGTPTFVLNLQVEPRLRPMHPVESKCAGDEGRSGRVHGKGTKRTRDPSSEGNKRRKWDPCGDGPTERLSVAPTPLPGPRESGDARTAEAGGERGGSGTQEAAREIPSQAVQTLQEVSCEVLEAHLLRITHVLGRSEEVLPRLRDLVFAMGDRDDAGAGCVVADGGRGS